MDNMKIYKKQLGTYVNDFLMVIFMIFVLYKLIEELSDNFRILSSGDMYTKVIMLFFSMILCMLIIFAVGLVVLNYRYEPIEIGIDTEKIYLNCLFTKRYINISDIERVVKEKRFGTGGNSLTVIICKNNKKIRLNDLAISRGNVFIDELNRALAENKNLDSIL